jgi:lysophospholipase L1-like esterase
MSIRPVITFLFVLSVLTILLILSAVFPSQGIHIGKFSLRFATPHDIFSSVEEGYADISDIINTNETLNDSLISLLSTTPEEEIMDTVRANADSLRKSIPRLKFARNSTKKKLYKAFAAFDQASTASKPVRIMHYGDSQIEGDRITSYVRNKLQAKFGGMGPGLVPVEQVYDFSFSILQETSPGWERYTLYGTIDTTLAHKRYGALANFCRFTPYGSSGGKGTDANHEAWVSFAPSGYSYSNTKHFQQCRVFFSHNTKPFMAEIYEDGALADADMYPASSSLKTIKWLFDQPVSDIKIVFRGEDSPDIYGIALDGVNGIAVDNIPMRGNSGLIFTKMDSKLLKAHFEELNVKLIILQFGGNIVPHVINDYSYYEKLFYNQLAELRQLLPDVAIIVIGVADMSVKERSRYVSYPNIEKVRDALKKASFRADAAYWDVYEAMGGKNSMPSWVFADPPLASSDFVHFNPRGARLIANMFYNALLYEYNQYTHQSKKNEETVAQEN